MHSRRTLILTVLMLALAAAPAQGIIIRHDRPYARYLELGAKYPQVCSLGRAGEGTLVGAEWVLTAAHVASAPRATAVSFDGREIAVHAKFIHPEWREGGPHDIALLALAEPVAGITPALLYNRADEAGKTVIFVGHGGTGNGRDGIRGEDRRVRGAMNVVESVDSDWLRFVFDEPPAGADLEGISGPGDSGGPAFIEVDGRVYVAGVSVFGGPGKYGRQTYGTREGYTRVSTHRAWLLQVMSGQVAAASAKQPQQKSQAQQASQSSQAPQAAPAAQSPAAAPKLPETPAGKRMAAWLPVIQKGDAAEIEKFVKENFAAQALERMSAAERANVHKDFFGDTGGVNLRAVKDLGEHEVEILAQAVKTGGWLRIALRVDPHPPHGILGFMFDEAQPPAASGAAPAAPPAKVSEAELPRAIGVAMDKLAADDRFSGSVLVAKNGTPIFAKAYGYANQQERVANTLDTKFNLGSMNKMFTAVAIAQLAEKGKLSFNDPVGKYLPDFPNAAVREKVTIHHLLTHTSGLGSYFGAPGFRDGGPKIRKVRDYLEFVKGETLAFEPGARFQYSNSGFIVLGAIIEKITGQDYYDYVRERIFAPAGMTNSASYSVDERAADIAIGYVGGAGNRRENRDTLPGRGGPAGGGYSTARDLLKFEAALRQNKLFSQKMRDTVLSGKVAMGPNGKYAYGFGDFSGGGHRMVGHNGGAPGINAELQIFWDDGYTIITMANYDRAASQAANQIRGMIFGGTTVRR